MDSYKLLLEVPISMLSQAFCMISPLDDTPEDKQDIDPDERPAFTRTGKWAMVCLNGYLIALITLAGFKLFFP